MASAKRRVAVNLNQGKETSELAMDQGKILVPGYSLTCIKPSDTNPRRRDLKRAGITLDQVKALAKRPEEDRDAFQQRMEEWIENQNMSADATDIWRHLMTIALSIHESRGVLQPIAVRVSEDDASTATLIAGERRFLASWLAGLDGIDAIVRKTDDPSLHEALIENTQRQDLSLSALIAALEHYQAERESPLSVREIVGLTGQSRGNAGVIRKTMALDPNHPAREALEKGTVTRVYHLNKLIQDNAEEKQKASKPGSNAGTQSQGDDSTPDATQTSEQDAAAPSSGGERPNLDTSTTQQPSSSAKTPPQPEPTPAHNPEQEWQQIRHWLISHMGPDPDGYWRARAEAVANAEMLYELVREMAGQEGE